MPTLTDQQVIELKLAHRQTREKRLADRIKAVLYLHYGLSAKEIARLLLFDEVTVSRYRKQYQEQGLPGLLELHYAGGQTALTLAQETELKEYLRGNTKRTAKEIADHVAKTYGIRFSVIGITKLLHRLGFAYKKPKIIPGKADPRRQEQFLAIDRDIKGNLSPHDQIYFADSTHPEHNPKPSYGWILKGKTHDKFIKTNTGRERLNINGALNLNGKTAVVLEEETINSRATRRLFKKLEREKPHGKIYLILDNASHHHSKVVKFWLKRHRRFKLIFLPPYSPNLNLIERLWRFFHAKITWNRYFETFEEFRRETLKFFRHLEKYRPELDTLLADNFQLVPMVPNLNLQT